MISLILKEGYISRLNYLTFLITTWLKFEILKIRPKSYGAYNNFELATLTETTTVTTTTTGTEIMNSSDQELFNHQVINAQINHYHRQFSKTLYQCFLGEAFRLTSNLNIS